MIAAYFDCHQVASRRCHHYGWSCFGRYRYCSRQLDVSSSVFLIVGGISDSKFGSFVEQNFEENIEPDHTLEDMTSLSMELLRVHLFINVSVSSTSTAFFWLHRTRCGLVRMLSRSCGMASTTSIDCFGTVSSFNVSGSWIPSLHCGIGDASLNGFGLLPESTWCVVRCMNNFANRTVMWTEHVCFEMNATSSGCTSNPSSVASPIGATFPVAPYGCVLRSVKFCLVSSWLCGVLSEVLVYTLAIFWGA